MTTIRKIVTSKIEGNDANTSNDQEIRPFGEANFYVDDNGPTNKLVLAIHDGIRTHLRSKVIEPGVLYGSNADSGDGANLDTIKLIPDAELHYNFGSFNNDQHIVIDPTAPNHIHIRAGGAVDNSNSELIIGGETSHLKVGAGPSPTVYIKSNDNQWTFETDGKLVLPGNSYSGVNPTIFGNYGVNIRPSWNNLGTGPELAISWNDGIQLTPITNDHFTVSNKATPFFIQGTDTDVAGKLPGDVYIDGGRNVLADVNGVVNIGTAYTDTVNIGRTGTATTITFNDGSILNGGDITGDQNVDGGGGAVDVWSSPVNTAGMTAKVVVSGKDLATGETQSCEVLLAKKQGSQSISATVYGIVHTSTDPLFTVSATVEANGQIKVNATVPGSIATVNVKSVGRVTLL